jgi:hypothetical protein
MWPTERPTERFGANVSSLFSLISKARFAGKSDQAHQNLVVHRDLEPGIRGRALPAIPAAKIG